MFKSQHSYLVMGLILVLCLIYLRPHPLAPKFAVPYIVDEAKDTKPIFESQFIPQPPALLAAHSATVEVLPNNDLIALWFAGLHEGKPDVKIYQSILHNDKWAMGHAVVSPQLLSKHIHALIYKVGNPVVYLAQNKKLHLFVVSVGLIGGWSGSSINHLVSNDFGQTWHVLPKLNISPLFNLSNLVRTNPVSLTDGGFYLPVYQEFYYTYPQMLRFDSSGDFIGMVRLNTLGDTLQPSVVPLNTDQALIFMRNKARNNDILYMQKTNDAAQTFTKPMATNITNHDSSLVVARISNNQLLMVHNPVDRSKLTLAISNDEGKNWKDVYTLEDTKNGEFSYPAMQIHGDMVDILYTWQRKKIKHVRFNKNWLSNIIGYKK